MAVLLGAQNLCSGSLITSYLGTVLFVVEAYLFLTCMSRNHRRFTRFLAIVMITADMLVNAANINSVAWSCDYSVEVTTTSPWLPPEVIALGLIGFCEHSYLTARFYLISKNIPVTVILTILSCAQFISQLVGAVYMARHLNVPPPLSLNFTAITIGWALGTTVDVLIAMALVWQFRQYTALFASTKSIIRKYVYSAVISGGLTAVYGIVLAILFAEMNEKTTQTFTILGFNFGKIYAITVFANLVLVQGMKGGTVILCATGDIPGLRTSTAPPDAKANTAIRQSLRSDNPNDLAMATLNSHKSNYGHGPGQT